MKPPRIIHAKKPKPRRQEKSAAQSRPAVVEARSPQQVARAKRYENRWVKQLMDAKE
jgi:hypothetical protein